MVNESLLQGGIANALALSNPALLEARRVSYICIRSERWCIAPAVARQSFSGVTIQQHAGVVAVYHSRAPHTRAYAPVLCTISTNMALRPTCAAPASWCVAGFVLLCSRACMSSTWQQSRWLLFYSTHYNICRPRCMFCCRQQTTACRQIQVHAEAALSNSCSRFEAICWQPGCNRFAVCSCCRQIQ